LIEQYSQQLAGKDIDIAKLDTAADLLIKAGAIEVSRPGPGAPEIKLHIEW